MIYPGNSPAKQSIFSDTEAPFSDLNLSNSNGIVSKKNIYDKLNDFDFDIHLTALITVHI